MFTSQYPHGSPLLATPESSPFDRPLSGDEAAMAAWDRSEEEFTRIISHERSPISEMPLMFPMMDLDEDDDDKANKQAKQAPSRFFLATPAEVFAERGLKPAPTGKKRLAQFASLAPRPVAASDTCESAARPLECHRESHSNLIDGHSSHVAPYHGSIGMNQAFSQERDIGDGHDDDNMFDEEVATAFERARRGPPTLSKFKLRPKPLSDEDYRDPNLLFRT